MCADMSHEDPGGDAHLVKGSGDSILDEDQELRHELEGRIAYIESAEYDHPALRPLTAGDWAVYVAAGIVAPILLLAWGALQL